jgi:hypothetical protein
MSDIFISYARKDQEFVRKLVDAVKAAGRTVWVDIQDIPFSSDWWQEIASGIESSQAMVFVISPNSIQSQVCGLEVSHALTNKKRLIPIVYQDVKGQTIPPELSHLNWIFFDTPEKFDESLRHVIEAVDTDLDAISQRTRLLVRAKEWEQKGHNPSLLLRGDALEEMVGLLAGGDLTTLQEDFLNQSLKRERRLQMLYRFGWGFLGGLLGMGFWAFSVFQSDQFLTPQRVIYTIVLGEVFGLFIGVLAVNAYDFPIRLPTWLSGKIIQLALRVLICCLISILAWAAFGWFYVQYPTLAQSDINSILLGGLGLAAGFIVRILVKLPGWLAALITAILTFIPIYFTFQQYWAGNDDVYQPLIQVASEQKDQFILIALPIVIFIALGANAQALLREARVLYKRLAVPTRTKTTA